MLPVVLLGVPGVPEHAHCEICGTTVNVGDRRCGSEACEKKFHGTRISGKAVKVRGR